MLQTKEKVGFFKKLLFSQALLKKSHGGKIAYIALTTALAVVVNSLEIKLGVVQFSLTMFFSAVAGVALGGGAGFCACFLGDAIGFLIHPMGEYSPWIGISTGLMALLIAYVCLLPPKDRFARVKLSLGCVLVFIVCTCGITTLYLNLVWVSGMTYFEYLPFSLFVQGQIWNSLANSVFIIFGMPPLSKIKQLPIKL